MKKKLRRTCQYCGRMGVVNEEVFWLLDLYASDMHDEDSRGWFHEDCAADNAREV